MEEKCVWTVFALCCVFVFFFVSLLEEGHVDNGVESKSYTETELHTNTINTSFTNAGETRFRERHLRQRHFKNISASPSREKQTPDSRETASLSDAPWVGSSFRLLQNEIIGGVREGEIAGWEFFWQTRQSLACVRPLFSFLSFSKMNYMLPRQPGRASVPGSALRFLIVRSDSTGCQTKHSTLRPKQSHSSQTRDSVIFAHGRQTFLLLLEYAILDFCNSLSQMPQLLPGFTVPDLVVLSAGLENMMFMSRAQTSKTLELVFFVIKSSWGRSDAWPECYICIFITHLRRMCLKVFSTNYWFGVTSAGPFWLDRGPFDR